MIPRLLCIGAALLGIWIVVRYVRGSMGVPVIGAYSSRPYLPSGFAIPSVNNAITVI